MANPTTAAPTVFDNPLGNNANLQAYIDCFGVGGAPRDIVTLAPTPVFLGDSIASADSGLPPTPTTVTLNGFTFPALQFFSQDLTVKANGRGWPQNTNLATPRTIACCFQVPATFGGTIALVSVVDDSGAYGLGIQVSNGAATLGFIRNFGFFSSGITIPAGTPAAAYLTITSATGRTFNAYNYNTQAELGQANLTDGTSFSFNLADNNVQIASGNPKGVTIFGPVVLANETWDSGTNTRFATYYADPYVWGRASYAPSASTLTAGSAQNFSPSTTGNVLTCTRPTGGASAGAYTYQWYRGAAYGTTPSGAGMTALTGQTSLTCADTTAAQGQMYYHICAQSDGTSTVYSNCVPAVRQRGFASVLMIGDSLTANTSTDVFMRGKAPWDFWRVRAINRGAGGTFVSLPFNNNQVAGAVSWTPGVFALQPSGSVSGGTFTLTWRGQTTGAIAYNASTATVAAALQALSTVGSGNATVTTSNGGALSTTSTYSVVLSGAALPSPVGATALTLNSSISGGGSVNCFSLYGQAVQQAISDQSTIASIMLGTNDLGIASATPSSYQTRLSFMINDLLASGIQQCIIHQVPWRTAPETSVLQPAQAALVNGTTIVLGDQTLYRISAQFPGSLIGGLHWMGEGYNLEATLWWRGLLKVLDPTNPNLPGNGGSGGTGGGAVAAVMMAHRQLGLFGS